MIPCEPFQPCFDAACPKAICLNLELAQDKSPLGIFCPRTLPDFPWPARRSDLFEGVRPEPLQALKSNQAEHND